MNQVCLKNYDNSWYDTSNRLKIILWYFTNMFIFRTMLPIPSSIKVKILRVFGSSIGKKVIIKPNVNIKYPWLLKIGDYCWIGEEVWIDNLAQVTLGGNVCLSQGSYLLTGSHNYKKKSFDLILGKIFIGDGVWIGAKSIVCPGVICKSHSVLSAGSVATTDLELYSVYQGNPAILKRKRLLCD